MGRKGEEEEIPITRLTPEVPSMERHAVYLHEKNFKWVTSNIDRKQQVYKKKLK